MKIINSVDSAITKGRWHNPGAKFYDTICTSKEALEEAYLVIGDKVGKDVPFTRSGCKYPHHSINKNGDLVLNVAGVRAAYQRAKQMGIFSGDIKDHLMRHYKELGIYKGSEMEVDKKITENFDFIENYLGIDESKYMVESVDNSSIEELEAWIDNVAHNGFTEYTEKSHGNLKYCYRIGFDKNTGEQVAVQFLLEPDKIVPPDKDIENTTMGKVTGSWLNNRDDIIKDRLNQQSEILKKSIRKTGYIDFTSKDMPVHAIFTRKDHRSMDKVSLIPFFSSDINNIVKKVSDKLEGNIDTTQKYDDYVDTILDSDLFKNEIRKINIPVEKYEIGKSGGEGKYKTTKLIWNNGLFSPHALTPALRGNIKYGPLMPDGDTITAPTKSLQNKYIKSFGIVRPKDVKEYVSESANDLGLFSISPDMEYEDIFETLLMEQSECSKGSVFNYGFNTFEYSKISKIQDLLNFMEDVYDDFTESFMDEYIDNYANDDNTINELLTKMDEINYDKSIQDWRLKSPSQVWNKKLGNCHDQSLYALNSLRQLGLEVGQLFFIEHNEGEEIDGNAHTLTWYKKDDEYYWFEHSWENYRGIHGPYDSLEELKSDVYKSWENDDDINSNNYEKIEFFDNANYKIGMTIGEYIDSWTQDEKSADEYTEKSHGNLKYCYRIGFDANTMKEVAVQFELDPDKITGVGDKNLTASIMDKRDDDKIDEIHTKALDLVKKNIKKFGNIDFKSDSMKVVSIFTKDGDKLNKVTLIPLFSNIVTELVRAYSKINPNINTDDLFKSDNFKRDLKAKLNDPRNKEEIYEVGKICGEDKYKTTKLMWGYDQMLSYKFTPVLRGVTPSGRGYNQNDIKKYLDKNLNNKFTGTLKEYVETADSIMEVFNDHWGSTMYKIYYMNEMVIDKYDEYGNPEIGFDMAKSYLDCILGKFVFTEADENDPPEIEETSGENKLDEVKEEPNQEENPEEEKDIMNEPIEEEPPAMEEENPEEVPSEEETSDKEQPTEEAPKEEPKQEKPLSMPKQTDAAEKSKNGVNRKKLYIAFIEWCKEYNPKNTFGSIFDKDIFHNVYPFVPEPCRYFYRLANPILCVLAGDLTFFQVSELRMINKDNPKLDEMMIFAATNDDLRVFNKKDNKVYLATEENGIKLGQVLGETFDLYIQNMIKKGDILNAPPETPNEE